MIQLPNTHTHTQMPRDIECSVLIWFHFGLVFIIVAITIEFVHCRCCCCFLAKMLQLLLYRSTQDIEFVIIKSNQFHEKNKQTQITIIFSENTNNKLFVPLKK